MKFDTKILREGQSPDPSTGAVTVPIFQTATYKKLDPGKEQPFEYSREGTPTSRALEENLASLEEGVGCVSFSSGMSAILAVLLSLDSGDRVVAGHRLYGGTRRLFDEVLESLGLEFAYTDLTDLSDFESSLTENTKLVFLETPTNPTLDLVDIGAVCERVDSDVTVLVDNTFLSPYFQKPLNEGADIVVHSLTKYLSGHNDLIGGAAITSDEEWLETLRFMLKTIGPTLAPTESFLALRGIKSLGPRMERHQNNAREIAGFLREHPAVESVRYPGFEDHPDYDVARKQMTGGGGMIAAKLGAGKKEAHRVVAETDLWIFADSLGGCDSLISHPATQSHEDVPEKERHRQGVTDGLLRLSAGLEDPEDLKKDLDQALSVL